MDYFNKSFVPLDVDGNPILSRAKQEELALERDLEAAGFAAAAKPSHHSHSGGISSSKRISFPTRDEGDPSYEVPLLPVDKGIFRRKGAPLSAAAGDEEQGLSSEFP
jgi:hypothetical protein